MRICHIAEQFCSRVCKIAIAQKETGHDVSFIGEAAPLHFGSISSFTVIFTQEHLAQEVRRAQADIFHVHNTPDWLVKAVKEASDGRPVIYDCHDLQSLRTMQEPDVDEKNAFAYADGIVHPSVPQKIEAQNTHGTDTPAMVLPSYMNRCCVPAQIPILPAVKTICYEGGLDFGGQVIARGPNMFTADIRNLMGIVKAFTDQDFQFFLFSAKPFPLNRNIYAQVGGVVFQPLPYLDMLKAIRVMGLGFVGACFATKYMDVALPNKLFEYISQGVVPVIFNAQEAGEFVVVNKMGIMLKGMENLSGQLAMASEIRQNLMRKRHEFIMEDHIQSLIDFYERVSECTLSI